MRQKVHDFTISFINSKLKSCVKILLFINYQLLHTITNYFNYISKTYCIISLLFATVSTHEKNISIPKIKTSRDVKIIRDQDFRTFDQNFVPGKPKIVFIPRIIPISSLIIRRIKILIYGLSYT